MAYFAGGLIEATDYNNLINGSNQLNTVLGVGFGDAGYGQTAISTVAATNTVTATQWATLINRLNSVRTHQSGVGSGIGAVTAGQTINHLATLQTEVNTAFNNRGSFVAQGGTSFGPTNNWNVVVGAQGGLSAFVDTNVAFANAQAARYFFNAGGQINFTCSASDNVGTSRSITLRDMVNQVGGLSAFRNYTNGGRTGSGGSIVVNNTSYGYRNLGSYTTIVNNDVGGTYGGHDVQILMFGNDSDTTNGAVTSTVVFRLFLGASADDAFGGDINLSVFTRADIVFPSTTHLTNTWGTPSIFTDFT